MQIGEGIRQTFEVIRANKIRSFLTMLGINFGVGSLIAISIVGLAFRTSVTEEMGKYGSQLIWVQPNHNVYASGEKRTLLNSDDINFFIKFLPGLEYRSSIMSIGANVRYRNKTEHVQIYGAETDYFSIFSVAIEKGRTFTDEDIKIHRRVCILRPDIAENLFGIEDPLLKKVTIFNKNYTVIGLTEKLERGFFNDGSDNSTIFIPMPFVAKKIWGNNRIKYWVYLMKFNTLENVDRAINRIDSYLTNKYGLLRHEKRFRIRKMDSYIQIPDRVLNIISTLILVIAAISLVVGGLGIMNIMLVTVTERTREIGIRMAVGARSTDILTQFIIEAVTLCLLGGGVGILFGIGIAAIACAVLKWKFIVSLMYVLLALSISTVIGLIFGIYPAHKASKMMPIEALRIE